MVVEVVASGDIGPFSASPGESGDLMSLAGSLSMGSSRGSGADSPALRGASPSCMSSENPVNPVMPVTPVEVVRSDMLFFHFLYEYHLAFAGERGVLLRDPRWIKNVWKAVNDTTVTASVSSIIWK